MSVDIAEKAPETITVRSKNRFLNRELAWLGFNDRVFQEALNEDYPLLERLRFLSISASNLDEFAMVRIAGLMAQKRLGVKTMSQDGLTPNQQLAAISARTRTMLANQQECWVELKSLIAAEGIVVVDGAELTEKQLRYLSGYFDRELFPVLTPLAIDPAHPFPFIPNFGKAMAIRTRNEEDDSEFRALVPLPAQLDRFVSLPGEDYRFILIEDVVSTFLDRLFPGFVTKYCGVFRVIRDSEIEIDEEAEDLVKNFESALRRRKRGIAIQLSVDAGMPETMREFVREELGVERADVISVNGLIGLADTRKIIVDDRQDLLFPPYAVRFPERIRDFGGDCFAAIRAKDIIVHHPYESFDVVVQFLRQAAQDPDVVAIKQTLYRTSKNSPIIAALIEAAESGKSVTAMVELKARFDEEANIGWARDLERAGAQVVFGIVSLKTHAKVSLVARREHRKLRTYCHFGTGNYHPITARIYTDLSYFTCDPDLCFDGAAMFNFMTGYARPTRRTRVGIAPTHLKSRLRDCVEREIANAGKGLPAQIWAKMNSLVDGEMIDDLYAASGAGVQIDLVVRGVCCLRPGVPGLSDNIRVRSIVGRFLEHSRIVCFANGKSLPSDQAEVMITSADWMPRNFHNRIEALVPLENATVRKQVLEQIMGANLKDETNSWIMTSDGAYQRLPFGPDSFSAHEYFMTNPSLSGRGSAVVRQPPEKIGTQSTVTPERRRSRRPKSPVTS